MAGRFIARPDGQRKISGRMAKRSSGSALSSQRRGRVSWDCASGFRHEPFGFCRPPLKQHDVNIVMMLRQLAEAESLERSTLHSASIGKFGSTTLPVTELTHRSVFAEPLVLGETPKSDVVWVRAASIAWSQFHHFAACNNEDVSHTLMPEPPFWRPV